MKNTEGKTNAYKESKGKATYNKQPTIKEPLLYAFNTWRTFNISVLFTELHCWRFK